MDKKIDSLAWKQDKRHAEQVKTNIQVAKQLTFLVDNMKKFLKYTTIPVSLQNPLLGTSNGMS